MQEFYDASEARAPELRERKQFAKMPELIARAQSAPGWAEQLGCAEAKISYLARGARRSAGAAQVGAEGPANGETAARRLRRHRAEKAQAAVDVAGPDF